ncbi:MAG: poly-gamma-glutamate hydrolase family protein [Gammaproteobacteria bacterium]
MDRYRNYAELSHHEAEGTDFRVHVRHGRSVYAIVAPHGGLIERGTQWLADAIAATDHTFYAFEGRKPRGNARLHITSNRFDEPRALAAVARVHTVVTVHGARDSEEAIYAGGRDLELRGALLEALRCSGFHAAADPSPTRQGLGPTNICNRGLSGRGVQFELPVGMRKRMFDLNAGRWMPNERFHSFVAVVRTTLETHCRVRSESHATQS